MRAVSSKKRQWQRCSIDRCTPTRVGCWNAYRHWIRSRSASWRSAEHCRIRRGVPLVAGFHPVAITPDPPALLHCLRWRNSIPATRRPASASWIFDGEVALGHCGRKPGLCPGLQMTPLVEAIGLVKHFPVHVGGLLRRQTMPLRAVDDVALRVLAGETLGLVGESGCGKSTLGRLLIRLIPPTSGNIIFDGTEITSLAHGQLRD